MRFLPALLALPLLAAPAGAQVQAKAREQVVKRAGSTLAVGAPAFDGRGVYVTQIGSDNAAVVRQSAPRARADLVQRGDANNAYVDQQGGSAYAGVAQTGDGNRATVTQAGVGANILHLSQTGAGNVASARQASAGALYNGAALAQNGSGNILSLNQDGSDNRAALTQNGDGNRMSAVQNGGGNNLAWEQQGNGLSDLRIVQNGGQALYITQTGGR